MEIMSEFELKEQRLKQMANDMVQEMNDGLARKESSLLMLSTYVHKLPNRDENGKYLALDFGGSTFRVISVELNPNEKPVIKSKTYDMDTRMKSVPGQELFDHLAICVANFISNDFVQCLSDTVLPLGFTFSFPMEQSSLSCGSLIRWTKGFENSNVVGENVADLLNSSLAKNQRTRKVRVAALANDTAGTLVAGCAQYEKCECGIILGTGSNAAYVEDVSNVPSMAGCTEEKVVINIEWGNFGEYGHLKDIQTEFDVELDKSSTNPGKALFEKMISGLYIGELVRLLLLSRVKNSDLFDGNVPDLLVKQNSFDGAVVSNCIRSDKDILSLFPGASMSDVSRVREICGTVSDRAAKLAAAGVYAIWLKRGRGDFTAAVDGSVFIKHVTFAQVMKKTLQEMGCTVKLEIASDGSGLGSALIAAMA